MNNTDSVKKRYFITLLVNLFKIVAGVINSTIIPSSLGVANYGNFNFLLKTFKSIQVFLTLSTGSAFFTYSSKNTKSANAFYVFYIWAFVQLVIIVLIALSTIYFTNLKEWLFPNQITIYIIAVGLLQWVNFIAMSLIQFGESKAESVRVQKINFISSLSLLALTVSFYVANRLDLNTFILINYISSVIIIFLIFTRLLLKKRKTYFEKYSRDKRRKVIDYFVNFCKPLVVYGIFGLLFNIFDRWILQLISGSVEQGYFSLAFRWVSLSMIFTTSIINVFWREISYSFGKNDLERVKKFYIKSVKFLFFVSASMAFAFFFLADNLIEIFFDSTFYGAKSVIKIMAFYPMFFTISQLNSTFLYATEKVKLHRNISIFSMILGVFISYILVAPPDFFLPGFDLASEGIATKLVIHSIIFVLIQLFFVLKYIDMSKLSLAKALIGVLIVFSIFSSGINFISHNITNIYMQTIVYIFLYTVTLLVVFYYRPQIAGLTTKEVYDKKQQFFAGLNKLFNKSS